MILPTPSRRFRSKKYRNNVEIRKRYLEGWSAWVYIRRVELAIEATGQLLIQEPDVIKLLASVVS
jgi:hypothetical protein